MSAALIAPPRTPRAGTLGQPRILLDPESTIEPITQSFRCAA